MSVQILESKYGEQACFYDASSMWAFGPVASGRHGIDAAGLLRAFQTYCPQDVRLYESNDLEVRWSAFLALIDHLHGLGQLCTGSDRPHEGHEWDDEGECCHCGARNPAMVREPAVH